jgi:hypothetical protein
MASQTTDTKAPNRVLGFVGLGVPITYYLWTRNNTKKPNTTVNERGANQEYTQSAEGNQKNGTSGHDEVCCLPVSLFSALSFTPTV